MFDRNERDMCATLSAMHTEAIQKARWHQEDAQRLMTDWIRNDKRFEGYDPQAVAERVRACKSNGATMDLDDPTLRGQATRPVTVVMGDDLATALLKVRVKNAEKALQRAEAAEDTYAIASARVTLAEVREQLQRHSGGIGGD